MTRQPDPRDARVGYALLTDAGAQLLAHAQVTVEPISQEATRAVPPGQMDALLALMDQSFDGGTDVQTPIERAIDLVHQAHWRSADLLIVSDGEFGCVPHTLQRLDEARARYGLRVQGVLVGDRETMGLLEVCDAIHWQRDWRRFGPADASTAAPMFSPVHSKSLTALYFPNALSARAARHGGAPR